LLFPFFPCFLLAILCRSLRLMAGCGFGSGCRLPNCSTRTLNLPRVSSAPSLAALITAGIFHFPALVNPSPGWKFDYRAGKTLRIRSLTAETITSA
jgi:hypothetical protein